MPARCWALAVPIPPDGRSIAFSSGLYLPTRHFPLACSAQPRDHWWCPRRPYDPHPFFVQPNHRANALHRRAAAAGPRETPMPATPPRETTTQAMALLDAQFPWLRGAAPAWQPAEDQADNLGPSLVLPRDAVGWHTSSSAQPAWTWFRAGPQRLLQFRRRVRIDA